MIYLYVRLVLDLITVAITTTGYVNAISACNPATGATYQT